MPDLLRVGYTRLFELRIIHHYWLDEGATTFDAIPDAAVRQDRLLGYDARRVVAITPRRATAALVEALGGFLRATNLGAVVAVPDDARIADDDRFEFHLSAADPAYGLYTAHTLPGRRVVSVTDPATHDVHRYKPNVPELSNLDGVSRGSGAAKRLFLSREYGINGDEIEDMTTVGPNVRIRTAEAPSSSFQTLGATADLPVFVHQGDVPAITPPTNTTGAPDRGVEVDDETPPDVIALIHVDAVRHDDPTFSIADAQGRPRQPHPVFEVHLRNRWTLWRYLDRSSRSLIETAPSARPLTYFGNAGTGRKPRPDSLVVETATSGTEQRVARLVSDIYV